jgi:hypothetical protein
VTNKEQEKALLEILTRWDPFPGSPEEKYQSLAGRILSALRRGGSGAEIEALIGRDMMANFGTDVPELEVRTIRQEIMAWWRKSD